MNKVQRCAVLASMLLPCVSGARALAQSQEQQKLVPADRGDTQMFGSSVALSGDTVLVGAVNDECAPDTRCGAAYVFRFNGTSWDQEQKLTASDAAERDDFGWSVALSGDTALVGAQGIGCAADGTCGAAYVYRFNGTSWDQEQKLIASDAESPVGYGRSVSLSGDTALVAAPFYDCGADQDCGAVYIFRFNGTSWDEEQKLTASDAAFGDIFGSSISVSGNTALVGAQMADCAAGTNCGAAYVFRFNGTSWDQEQKLTASDAGGGDVFGWSVALSGDTALVGARRHACAAGGNCGAAYVYRFNGSSWVEQQKLTASDAGSGDVFGTSVAVSGETAVVGSYLAECAGGGFGCGAAYVFQFNGTSWDQEQKLTASDADINAQFGISASVDGETIAVSAWQDHCPPSQFCGAAYMFQQSGGMGPVPAVSEWGVAVMALLMLTAGTIVLARRRKAALGC